ncbi:MAG TPA: energy-coupling factor transporter transmembrane protein EcfT [Candidatus Nesterenkonia stercoripullorum]|uniref:Energy-coupling factor transporter transmembrane protein EcfT n=1 Tax=Candidatus Nesterenkonia stercoripullorum TaxID=2838701 RepID=A0A9D1RZR1_9MICC|nr:energy-coupling factor transporter transmembrane protein EcfT [Candidatus Nesterenkonia stercoripullorum]
MIPLYRPGTSPVHHLPVGVKFVLIFAAAAMVSLQRESVWAIVTLWAITLVGYLMSGAGAAGILAQLWRLKWLVVVLTVPQLIFLDLQSTGFNVSRVLGVVMMAALLTRTTRTSDILASFEAVLRPLERAGLYRLGFDADRISLALSLTIRSVPVVMGFYTDIREAQRARGARAAPHRMIMPLLVMTLHHADETAEALAARGA